MDPITRFMQRIASSKPGTWLYLNVFHVIDRRLLVWTKGRVSVSVGQPVLLLKTTGAKSGEPRTTPLIYMRDGDDIIVIGSNGGSVRHPAWVHNLRANPEAMLTFAGREGRYVAREAQGDERIELWRRAEDFYVGFSSYAQRAGDRRIAVVVLSPATGDLP